MATLSAYFVKDRYPKKIRMRATTGLISDVRLSGQILSTFTLAKKKSDVHPTVFVPFPKENLIRFMKQV
jgi:hypothetical protein